MPHLTRVVSPGPDERSVRTASGEMLHPPPDWVLLPPGDAGLTRRVRATGPTWAVQEKRGRKTFSRGTWASSATVERIRGELQVERSTPQFARKREVNAARRERQQNEYIAEFRESVLAFLAFDTQFAELADRLAFAVTNHATPVGSGTVARTKRIPVEQRAESAVIAWMRHRTTAYDDMKIARVKGKRREVRRMLADQSKRMLASYRSGQPVDAHCPLWKALQGPSATNKEAD